MKYIIVLGDGMADEPIEELGGITPLAYADTTAMDELAVKSEIGLSYTIPDGMSPGSDTANLAVLGYNPRQYYTGRSPLEALSIGVAMKDTDIAIRANLVTLSDDTLPYEEKAVIDHSAGEISTEDALVLLEAVKKELADEVFQYYLGTSYRHLLIWQSGRVIELTPPHDILGNRAGNYLPEEELLKSMMIKSYDILNHHPLNEERASQGLNKANSLWFWGAGTKPALDSFQGKTGLKAAMISAVDLLKGIAVGAGMTNLHVEGADGTLHTNYKGKAMAAVSAVTKEGFDFVYVHVEAPDEMGHQGNIKNKIAAIEYLDSKVVRVIMEEMKKAGEDYRMLIMPDHPTPIKLRTHTCNPVPYLLYDSTKERSLSQVYTEDMAAASGNVFKEGYRLIEKLYE